MTIQIVTIQNEEPKWKRFEKLAAEIQEELASDAEIRHNAKLNGEDSETERQIDIVVRKNVGQYRLLIVMQCKDEKAPLDVNVVGEFASVVSDVRANKGALVSSSGFTKAAINLARQKGIDTFRLIDVQNKDWRSYASLPAAAIFDELEHYQLKFADNPNFPPERFVIPLKLLEDIPNLPLYREDGTLIDKVINLIRIAWNNDKLPRENGEHRDLRFLDEPVFIKDEDNLVPIEITVSIKTRQRFLFGHIPIKSMRGFQNVATGGVYTRSVTTEWLNTEVVEKEWQPVESLEQLAVKPIIILHATNLYESLQPESKN